MPEVAAQHAAASMGAVPRSLPSSTFLLDSRTSKLFVFHQRLSGPIWVYFK